MSVRRRELPGLQEETPLAHEDPVAAHERLVAYVHAINGDPEPRQGVWMEHSYARARGEREAAGADAAPRGDTRTLLLRRPPRSPPPADLDVQSVEVGGPAPPDPPPPPDSDALDSAEEEPWETRVEAQAPSAAARRLAGAALGSLRALRLARLAGVGGARDEARAAARRLRRALAPLWGGGAPAWLHATLSAVLPPRWRALYTELLAELRRDVPRLMTRLQDGKLPAAAPDPAPRAAPAVMPMWSRPLLVWLGSGRERQDARWERRLRALVPTHYIRLPNLEACGVEAWCAAVAGAARAALGALDAGTDSCSLLALGGAGAGAALALQLAAGAGAGALLLLAPPLLTAEGPRTAPDDPLAELRLPALLVVGACGAQCWAGAAGEVGAAGTRTLLVGGADDELRLPHARRRALRLPQHALDAAIVEECARWLTEVSEGSGAESGGDAPPSPPLTPLALSTPTHTPTHKRHYKGVEMEDEYAHLPPARPAPAPAPAPTPAPREGSSRSIEIVEGRVVSRVCGSVPLALVPPPRRAPPTPADILSMPIVFADDEPPPPPPPPPPGGGGGARGQRAAGEGKGAPSQVIVKSGGGAFKYSKVIVAKRGGAVRGAGGRPIVVRGGVRLLRPGTSPAPAPL